MRLALMERDGKKVLEGKPGEPLLNEVDDAAKLVEACFNFGTRCLLLYAENLTPKFFDLSSLEAGNILQKLRTYKIRIAVVRNPTAPPLSSTFAELMREESRQPYFRMFEDREQAEAWVLAT